MDSIGAATAFSSSFAAIRSLGSASSITLYSLTSDQSSAQIAKASVTQATQQLQTDQAPRGTPAAIAADNEAVKLAQQAVEKASARLQSDRSQSLVDVFA